MKIRPSELKDEALDTLVAKCEGKTSLEKYWFFPSTDWAQAGPIIEREVISIFDLPSGIDVAQHPTFTKGDLWEAEICPTGEDSIRYCGPTPLVAAMRCYVASKLGDEIETPEGLIE